MTVLLHPSDAVSLLIVQKDWDWTFDELARYDLPAMVAKVLDASGSPFLLYVGHSQVCPFPMLLPLLPPPLRFVFVHGRRIPHDVRNTLLCARLG